jgi:ATP-dependent protease ClpP protease subunit
MAEAKYTTIEKREQHLKVAFEYKVNLRQRVVTLVGEVNDDMFVLVDQALTELEDLSKATVTVRLLSEGGHTYSALGIVGRLRRSKCKIVVEGYGAIMSAATLILASGDERRVASDSWFMHHEETYEFEGRHSEHKDYVEQQEKEEWQWCKAMAEYTGQPAEFWYEEGRKRDAYFEACELVSLGVADKLI